ncbi:MAG: deoxyguanosinetriphosphate triphosphohydrolase [Ardenticatenaceae bacterium]|nr:deoxyguanosinetriphosphate triphosphohydrolase [Ardenticatenaceae bacterium]
MLFERDALEKIENASLAPYALKSADSKGRVYEENESKTRTAFQRDRDRIIHTTAFRRLEYKTQVFIYYEGDHYRTRLTHTIEVAQIGKALARGMGANQDLTEAICLAHDLGHSPFGHAGEHALNRLMADHGGFNHNAQSYRVVTELENRYPQFPGLNLSYETREGIIKHETDYDDSHNTVYAPDKRASLEAQIANLADETAYNAHDLDDGIRAGILDLNDLEQLAIWQRLRQNIKWHDQAFDSLIRRELIRELIGLTVTDLVQNTHQYLEDNGLQTADDIQTHSTNIVDYSEPLKSEVKELKAFLYENMYRHYRLVRMQTKAERFIEDLFNAYIAQPRMLPSQTQAQLAERPVHRVVTDYIAGMTDRYALNEWERLFMPQERP